MATCHGSSHSHQDQDQEINGSLGPGPTLSPTTTPPPLLTLPRLLWRYQGERPPRYITSQMSSFPHPPGRTRTAASQPADESSPPPRPPSPPLFRCHSLSSPAFSPAPTTRRITGCGNSAWDAPGLPAMHRGDRRRTGGVARAAGACPCCWGACGTHEGCAPAQGRRRRCRCSSHYARQMQRRPARAQGGGRGGGEERTGMAAALPTRLPPPRWWSRRRRRRTVAGAATHRGVGRKSRQRRGGPSVSLAPSATAVSP